MNWGQRTLSKLSSLLDVGDNAHSLALLDVDHLAKINARAGRSKGDDVLTDAAEMLQRAFGEGFAEHWLGDQFLVLMPSTSAPVAARRICDILAESSSRSAYTLCAGGATSPVAGSTNRELIAAASSALRQAKIMGPGTTVWSALTDVPVKPSAEGRRTTRMAISEG